jgi:subtilisin family serine protease
MASLEAALGDDEYAAFNVRLHDGIFLSPEALGLWSEQWRMHLLDGYHRSHARGRASGRGRHYFSTWMTRRHAERMRTHGDVEHVQVASPEFKVSANLATHLRHADTAGSIDLDLMLTSGSSFEHASGHSVATRAEAALRSHMSANGMKAAKRPVSVKALDERHLSVHDVPRMYAMALIKILLAAVAEVVFVEERIGIVLHNHQAAYITQSGKSAAEKGATVLWDRGITGLGQVVGCSDTGLDHQSCMFDDENNNVQFVGDPNKGKHTNPLHRKVVKYVAFAGRNPEPGNIDHGTHVLGSVCGNPNQVNLNTAVPNTIRTHAAGGVMNDYRGMAYEAKASFFDIGVGGGMRLPNQMSQIFGPSATSQGFIHTNSWGQPDNNAYSPGARQTDAYMYDNQNFLVLYAAGNAGQYGFGSVSSPATSKNGIAVGASINDLKQGGNCLDNQNTLKGFGCGDHMAKFSSLGATFDSRFKPEITAPGHTILSTMSNAANNCQVIDMSGTSMASPVTAGVSALIRQYLTEGFYPYGKRPATVIAGQGNENAWAADIHALLINSARQFWPF